MQTNETQNRIMHFGRNADGQLELLESIPTAGAGSGVMEIVALVAQFSLTNFFNNVFDPEKDFPAVTPAGSI
jgi:hypothetical protein